MPVHTSCQNSAQHFLTPADTLHKARLFGLTVGGGVAYTGTLLWLSQYWYKDYPRSAFHAFDDWGEWENLDKYGHALTAQFESEWAYSMLRWAGVKKNKAVWYGAGSAMLLQGTIEILDGFSSKWGFSVADLGSNIAGAGLFVAQQKLWGEQRIRLKYASSPGSYPHIAVQSKNGHPAVFIDDRAEDLFGTSLAERMLKDYNGQTYWLSVNPSSFSKQETFWPDWLNLAVGYGAEHMIAGFENTWIDDDTGAIYDVDPELYHRYRQYYVSLDIDFSRIPSRSPLVRTLLGMLNVVKVPAPALEVTSGGEVRGHWLFF